MLLVLAAAAAYVTLPWWAPTSYIRRKLAGMMSEQMGVDVRIASMSLSWSGGVEIRDMTIESPPGFGDEPMAFVEKISAEFSPVNFFVYKRLGWMKVEGPRHLL